MSSSQTAIAGTVVGSESTHHVYQIPPEIGFQAP